ncbi:MAG: SprT family zinc-dependent metalloprotease [Flectobacillus sp.]|jgi:predicted metal-dependent hydrolase|nr:SprT family zinc-dependent metalloprotease [Flectobacillus sp.]
MVIWGIDIQITKSSRKTVSIYIERDGTVAALVPEQLTDEQIMEVIKTKEYQIHRHLAQWIQLNEAKVEREYVSGQSFMYLGRNYRLRLVDEKLGEVKLKNGYFLLSKQEKMKAKELFVEFYKAKLKEKISPIIERYKGQLGVTPQELKIMELQHRWASCTIKGNVNFHWKCAMAPIDVLNYIVVHELAHIIHPNHSPEFWNTVDKVLANYDSQIKWLRLNGAGMDL